VKLQVKLHSARLLAPVVTGVLLIVVLLQTAGALHGSGVWAPRITSRSAASPFTRLESLLGAPAPPAPADERDPFDFVHAPAPVPVHKPAVARVVVTPPVPARPVLTSIVWVESNPSATVRWNGQDYPVQVNSLFGDFRVRAIARDQVTLERGGELLVLRLPKKGD
jgi:hypothetical protein